MKTCKDLLPAEHNGPVSTVLERTRLYFIHARWFVQRQESPPLTFNPGAVPYKLLPPVNDWQLKSEYPLHKLPPGVRCEFGYGRSGYGQLFKRSKAA